ncbi:MAG: rhodanese-related sulfurtransferase [Saprospiraceae bacterium]|nr:rhodanese-related sulfurtransferase [Saprospiraceae bacterium]MBK7810573.1 rhodanese-related sulfurtransferase [Saprospiraceae bacterium]MBK9630164.1 rhodanese-related sulfurtransferase [Saprospiraceae bacterium]
MAKPLFNRVDRKVLLERMKNSPEPRRTISFYKYAKIGNPQIFRDHLYLLFEKVNVLGRIYIAREGINAQISVPEANLENFIQAKDEIIFLQNIRLNFAIEDDGQSFFKLLIKVRNKIVADGLDDQAFDVTNSGVHLNANEFNQLSSQENAVIVDMRNHYESEVGHFKNAITPEVVTFRESLPIIADLLAEKKDQPILMYCTGGIRCEKASAYMKYRGFKDVYQLNGGIIEYARQVKSEGLENKFVGKNFVFDERLGEKISDEIISRCHQCGSPSDQHTNCMNDHCHILFIQCASCANKYEKCCSNKCAEYYKLTEEEKQKLQEQNIKFNGSGFSKGRYKALKPDQGLNLH